MSVPVMGLDESLLAGGGSDGWSDADDELVRSVYDAALALGIANQLTNILRDVGEDVDERNRIYVPLGERGNGRRDVRLFICPSIFPPSIRTTHPVHTIHSVHPIYTIRPHRPSAPSSAPYHPCTTTLPPLPDELAAHGIAEDDVLNYRARLVDPATGRVDPRWVSFMRFQIQRAREFFAAAEAGADRLHPDARAPVWTALILYRGILDAVEANGYDNLTQRAYVPKWKKLLRVPLGLARARWPGLRAPGIPSLPDQ